MPYCTQCGCQVGDDDVFCAACGARQQGGAARSGPVAGASGPRPAPAGAPDDVLGRMPPRKAALLCYIPFLGWIMSIVVLAAERFRNDRTVRFHAFQGLYLFVLWLFADWVFGPITSYTEATRMIGRLLKLAVVGSWIFMIVKVRSGDDFHLPVLGDLAERSVAEQR